MSEQPRITPIIEDGELPLCSISCPESSNQYDKGHMYLDGAQCRVTGAACETLCEPAVRRMAQRLEASDEVIEEMCEDVMTSRGMFCREGEFCGWYDTCALSDVRDAGDRLVALGKWERHPDGYGRRWWYRPTAAAAAKEGAE